MFDIKFHNGASQIESENIDAEKIRYTSKLVKFYTRGALIDVFSVDDLVDVTETKKEVRFV
jgi:hypothetical protein